MTHRWTNRIGRIERDAKKATRATDAAENARAEIEAYRERQAEWLLCHVPDETPEEIVLAIYRQMAGDCNRHSEDLALWYFHPFARWAMPIPRSYVFPMALLAFLADPPGEYCSLHTCGACGLHVPVRIDLPAAEDRHPFPACPACGGATSSAAHWSRQTQ